MATVKFLLRNKFAKESVSINYDIHLSATHRLRGSTNVKITPQYWDEGKQQIRNVTALSSTKDSLNRKLTKFRSFVLEKVGNYETTNINDIKQLLKEDLEIYLGKKDIEIEEKLTFYSFIEKFIEQSKSRVSETTGKKLAPKTIQDYERTRDRIQTFEKLYKFPISFETINLDFYYSFKDYLEDEDFSINYIGKFIKNIKVFMNAATDEGLNTNFAFRNKYFVKPSVNFDHIYLNLIELEKIFNLDLSDSPKMSNARDLFIIGAFTGLRVSDFNGLTKENIKTYKNKRFFHITVKKSGKYLPIPLHPEVEKILKKNNGHPPSKMKSQDINDELPKIGAEAKIKEIITVRSIKGGENITENKEKCDLIRNHTARRSFCTNAYIAGMPTLDIMAISGHTSERSFLNYIKITADERAIKIAENSFFNPVIKLEEENK